MKLFFIFYNLLCVIGLFVYLPSYLRRKKFNLTVIKERFLLKKIRKIKKKGTIWIHAVSVGEVNLVKPLARKLQNIYPDKEIVITTITSTGNKVARQFFSPENVFFLPYDFSFLIEKAISHLMPDVFICVETEIWPVLFLKLKEKNIPVIVVNGRISNKAYKAYKKVKLLMRPFFNCATKILVQNDSYRKRFISLGVAEEKLVISGNLKFSSLDIDLGKIELFKNSYSKIFLPNDIVLIAASTHYPEEETILRIFKELNSVYPNLKLIIAPRHPERSSYVIDLVKKIGFMPQRISKRESRPEAKVYILDTVGDLTNFYSLADICFVGGSLANFGGHNILEPAFFKKPIIFGPFMHNFQDIKELFLTNNAACLVNDNLELKNCLEKLINNSGLRVSLGEKAYSLLKKETESFPITLNLIKNYVRKKDFKKQLS